MIQVEQIAELSPGRLVPHYLMAGWLYEYRGETIMTDPAWDALCARLAAEWDTIGHVHKCYVDRDSLGTATAAYLTDTRVPYMARCAAIGLANRIGIDPGPMRHAPFDQPEPAERAPLPDDKSIGDLFGG